MLHTVTTGVLNYTHILLINVLSEKYNHKTGGTVVPLQMRKDVENFIANKQIPTYFIDAEINNYQLYEAFKTLVLIGICEYDIPDTIMEIYRDKTTRFKYLSSEKFLTELTMRFTHSWANWPIAIPYSYSWDDASCTIHWDESQFPNF